MTKTTTTTTGQDMTDDEKLRKALASHVNVAKEQYETTLATFLASAQRNPAAAIADRAEGMVAAQTKHEVWLAVDRQLAEHDPRAVLAMNLNECQRRMRSFCRDGICAGMASNSVECARAGALVRQVEVLEDLTRRFGT